MIRHFQPAQLRHIQALHTVSVPLLLIIRQKSLQLAKIVLCILCKIMRMPVRMVHLSTLRRKCLWGTVGIAAIVMRIRMCTDLLPGRCSNFMYQLRRIQDLSRAFFLHRLAVQCRACQASAPSAERPASASSAETPRHHEPSYRRPSPTLHGRHPQKHLKIQRNDQRPRIFLCTLAHVQPPISPQ